MSKKLLLADDSITIQKVIGITFANEDYELTIVDNGDTALERAREIHPDLVLADVFMPGRNGYELCAAIKQDPALHHIPVLLLTGTFEPFDEEKARRASADSWISKPFESQNLIDRVEELLSAAPTPASPPAATAAPIAVEVPEPAAEEAPAEGIWGDLDLEAPAPAVEAAAIPPVEADPWGSIAFDEADLQPTAPELEEEFIFEDEELLGEAEPEPSAPPITEPAPEMFAAPEPPPAASAPELGEADWGDFEEEILPLDDSDILDAEELVEGEEEGFFFAAEEETPAAGQGLVEEEFIFEEEAAVSELQEDLEMDALFAEEPTAPATGEALEPEDFFAQEKETPPASVSEDWDLPAEAAAPAAPVAEAWDFDLAEPPAAPPLSAAPEVPTPPVAPEAPAAAQAPAAAADAVEEQVAAFSEADLERIVERVAGAIVERLAGSLLEKVVWEVVPDLAESLIREEIGKITRKTA